MDEFVEDLKEIGFKEYHAKTLLALFRLGESKAPKISEISGVPKNRVYEVLKDLGNRGLVEVKPGKPKKYRPKKPKEFFQRLKKNKELEKQKEIQEIQKKQKNISKELNSLFSQEEVNERGELLRLIDVGEPSERETKLLYQEAKEEILIATKAMEYLPRVKKQLKKATKKDIKIKALFLEPSLLSKENRETQKEILSELKKDLFEVKVRFSNEKLPLRGTIVDPSYEYKRGKAIFLVEEKEVPLSLREAALTENPSLVAGTAKYFNLIWENESKKIY